MALAVQQRLACPSRATPPRSATPRPTIHRQPRAPLRPAPTGPTEGQAPPSQGSKQPQQKAQVQPHPGLAPVVVFVRVRGHRVFWHPPPPPPPEESGDSRNVDSTMRPLDPSDSLTVSDGSSAHRTGPSTSVESAPSSSGKDAHSWP